MKKVIKIGYCTGRKLGPSSQKRFDVYKRQLQSIDEEVNEEWIFTECFTLEDGVRVAHKLKEMQHLPEALIVAGDEVAIGVMTEAEKLGIQVPEDLAIIGFDNQPISQVLQLTTIDQNLKEIGKKPLKCFIGKQMLKVLNKKRWKFHMNLWSDLQCSFNPLCV